MSTQERFLRLPQVQARVPWSRATIARKVSRGEFPRPHRIGGRTIAWAESEVDAWIASHFEPGRNAGAAAVIQ